MGKCVWRPKKALGPPAAPICSLYSEPPGSEYNSEQSFESSDAPPCATSSARMASKIEGAEAGCSPLPGRGGGGSAALEPWTLKASKIQGEGVRRWALACAARGTPFSCLYGFTRTSNEYGPDGCRSSSMTCLGTARARAAASGVVHSTKPHPRSTRTVQLTTVPNRPK